MKKRSIILIVAAFILFAASIISLILEKSEVIKQYENEPEPEPKTKDDEPEPGASENNNAGSNEPEV